MDRSRLVIERFERLSSLRILLISPLVAGKMMSDSVRGAGISVAGSGGYK